MNPKVDEFLEKTERWQEGLTKLRAILLDCQLDEALKWRQPAYTYNKSNIAIIGGFKDFFVLSFFKGVLLGDPEKILVQQGENTQSARVLQFKNASEVDALKETIKAYVFEAIEVEKAGLKVEFKASKDLVYPDELLEVFEANPAFKTAFFALTPGRQKAYNLFFTGAKQAKTRAARVGKYQQRIMDGIGINDCTCGLTKRKPNCDGSHKQLER